MSGSASGTTCPTQHLMWLLSELKVVWQVIIKGIVVATNLKAIKSMIVGNEK
jgi:hypothetical protein